MAKKTEITETKWFVYIVRCDDDSLYTGISTDVERRVTQHNAGTASKYTRSRRPVSLLFQEERLDRSDATKRELEIKSLSRQEKKKLIARFRPPHKRPSSK